MKLLFLRQPPDETVDCFVNRLKKLASSFQYGTLTEEIMRDRLVIVIQDKNTKARFSGLLTKVNSERFDGRSFNPEKSCFHLLITIKIIFPWLSPRCHRYPTSVTGNAWSFSGTKPYKNTFIPRNEFYSLCVSIVCSIRFVLSKIKFVLALQIYWKSLPLFLLSRISGRKSRLQK